jgi:hypothetical protein
LIFRLVPGVAAAKSSDGDFAKRPELIPEIIPDQVAASPNYSFPGLENRYGLIAGAPTILIKFSRVWEESSAFLII